MLAVVMTYTKFFMMLFYVIIGISLGLIHGQECGIGLTGRGECENGNCGKWELYDGEQCVGYCNNSCYESASFCRIYSNGFTCLCSSDSSGNCQDLVTPSNVKLTWKSAHSVTFSWNVVSNAYLYRATVSNSTWKSRAYVTTVPVAAFTNLTANSDYSLEVYASETSSHSSDRANINFTTNARPSKSRIITNCDVRNKDCTKDRLDECDLGMHRCHVEAKCIDKKNGYQCICNPNFVGNGTHCIGVCGGCRQNQICYRSAFGSSCSCLSGTNTCQELVVPNGVIVMQQTSKTLAFKWNSQSGVTSYKATLTSDEVTSYRNIYNTVIPRAAFTFLEPSIRYRLEIRAQYLNLDSDLYSMNISTSNACMRGNMSCHVRRAHCSSSSKQCECLGGYYGDGFKCRKIFAQQFRQNLTSSLINHYTLRSDLLLAYQSRNKGVIDVIIITQSDSTSSMTYLVLYWNPRLNFNLLTPRNISQSAGKATSESDVCSRKKVSGFEFESTLFGSEKASVEKCPDGVPAARISCVRHQTKIPEAFLFRSHFNKISLNITACRNLTTVNPEPTTYYDLKTSRDVTTISHDATTISYDVTTKSTVVYESQQFQAEVPQEAIQQAIKQLNVSGVTPIFREENANNFPSPYNVTVVITIDIGTNVTIENLETPVRIRFKNETTINGETSIVNRLVMSKTVQRCVFWDEDVDEWSSRGCCLNDDLYPPTCECDHLSSFALIVSTIEVPSGAALSTVSDIGCILSIIGSAATFVTILLNRDARQKTPNKILLHITMNLFITYTIFIAGVSRFQHYQLCTAISIFLHYTFLVTWFWMAVYSNRLYSAFVKVFTRTGPHFMVKASAIAYGVPLIIVAINVGLAIGYFDEYYPIKNENVCNAEASGSHYRGNKMCWINGYSLYFGFLVIIGLVLLNNIIVFVLVMKEVLKRKAVRSTQAKRSKLTDIMSACTLSFTLGISWLFGFLMLLSTNITYNYVMSWLFAIFNAFQGVFIWYVTCVKRDDLRQFWWDPVKKFCSCFLPRCQACKGKPQTMTKASSDDWEKTNTGTGAHTGNTHILTTAL